MSTHMKHNTVEVTNTMSGINLKFAYYPGCSLSGTAVEYGMSTKALCNLLEIELEEIPDWICCGATPAHAIRTLFPIALGARNLALAAKLKMPILTVCAACFNRLKFAAHELKHNSAVREKISQLPELLDGCKVEQLGDINVLHLLSVLHDIYGVERIKGMVKHSLSGLKVACYYGCLLVRPPKVMQFDDPENPQLMDRLIEAIGAETVDWAYKVECCGASLALSRSELVAERVHLILSDAKARGAQVICVACPLCHVNLDVYQVDADAKAGQKHDMPIVYFTQLIALALGASVGEVGLNKHMINPIPVLSAVLKVTG
ncbi:MAG: CoB--CoM heterodisulfide reductase iron-sulfur subunit B family protein [Armatimonadota bacterium]|nr:CoB--CoM heterodisulfide reductase iron-sulfur subunit B family protein [Armatimonadota bacterium]MCX7776695.1 CoB--CoM heterodisulfide reductase iron-sulfur subunit B family protein [Armatimonadota bacterium]MDW8026333.1 CoB--CoM heterodisulfide reductase iron-sulfur subunit B family protein [Armatimonadota bacterium]